MSSYSAFTSNDDDLVCGLTYYANPNRWNENITDLTNPILDETNWSQEYKYLNSTNDDISDEINSLPENTGGVYIFYIKGISLPFVEKYIAYIGRCQYTDGQNIKKRAREYIGDKREKIKRMFKHWNKYLFYRYYPDTDNERIKANEAMLIRAIVPPFNENIPNRIEIEPTVNAF